MGSALVAPDIQGASNCALFCTLHCPKLTPPIIYVLEEHTEFAPIFRPVFEAHENGLVRLAVTTVTLAEVLTGPLRTGDEVLVERYRSTLKSWYVVVSRHIPRLRRHSWPLYYFLVQSMGFGGHSYG